MRLLHHVDCTAVDPAYPFFSCGETRLVPSPAGTYREAEAAPLARFGYRLPVQAGKPHLLRVRYPDDKRRFMMIGDGTSYDLSTAVITGHAWPLSGEMQWLEELFWPRFSDLSVCFMSWGCGEAAAAGEFEIHELDETELAPLALPGGDGFRTFGVQYEDPCGTGASEGAKTFEVWLDRVIRYLRHSGQNHFAYPLCWYHGPLFPGTGERADVFSIVVDDDRRQYMAWCDDPDDWPAKLLQRCETEGIGFYGVFTLLRLESLMRRMHGGDLTNRLWNNQAQSGTMDWTVVYHTGLFTELVASGEPYNLSVPRNFAYGELSGNLQPPGPIFNPLHPEVQRSVIEFFAATCRHYSRFSSFKGIAVTLWAPTLLWFGTLRSGYDDYSVGEFERETGIRIPAEPDDPGRFAKRYDFLTLHCRDAWIDWRCARIRQFIRAIRDAMTAVRPDLRLSLTLWNEPFIPAVRGCHAVEHQLWIRSSMAELYREAGIDPGLFAGEANIDFALQTEGGGRDRTPGNRPDAPLEAFQMFRDHDFLDDSVWRLLRLQEQPAVYVFNAWHEAWGDHRWFDQPGGDPPDIATYGCRSGSFRINSEYPPDGFWWDSQLRIAPAFPPAPHYMEYFAHALAESDAVKLTAGGLFLDKCHTGEFRAFAEVFRRLPARRFQDLPQADDPVKIRLLAGEDESFLYLVNREYCTVGVTLRWRRPCAISDLAGNGRREPSTVWTGTLQAYQLAGLRFTGPLEITEAVIVPEAAYAEKLRREARRILELAARPLPVTPPSFGRTVEEIRRALEAFRPARLRHLLHSYAVVKMLDQLGEAPPAV